MTDVAVVGAGLAGLTAALRITESGHRVKVFERYPRPGGLARVMEVEGEPLEAFYHHLFTSDTAYISLAEELGVADLIEKVGGHVEALSFLIELDFLKGREKLSRYDICTVLNYG